MRIEVNFIHSLGDLDREMRRIPGKAATAAARSVKTRAEQGNRSAKAFATKSAGSHGKHYPDAFSAEAISAFEWEYGPDASKPQGGMSFEYGSRNQPPHMDLNKSADIVGPKLDADMRKLLDRLFW